MPADDIYIKNSKQQLNHYFELSVYVEKVKSSSSARQIGSNKIQPGAAGALKAKEESKKIV